MATDANVDSGFTGLELSKPALAPAWRRGVGYRLWAQGQRCSGLQPREVSVPHMPTDWRYFEDFEPGRETEFGGTYEIREEEIIEVGTRWDPQPFHVDPEAARESMFGGLVASSVHLFAAAVRLGQNADCPVRALTALGFKELQWHAPARPGDSLRMRSRTLRTRRSRSRPGCGIVESRSEVLNQDGELVFSYVGAALIECRPQGEAAGEAGTD